MLARKEAAAALANDAKAKDTAAAPRKCTSLRPARDATCTCRTCQIEFLAHPQGAGTRCRKEAKLLWVALWHAQDKRAHANKPHALIMPPV